MAYHVGKVIKLHQREGSGTRKVSGLVKLDKTSEVLEFSGIISLTPGEINKTKIFGTILNKPDGVRRMIRVKRF